MIKAIVFDFGYTLFNPEEKQFYPEVKETLDYLSKKYELIIISIANSSSPEYRLEQLEKANLSDYFLTTKFVFSAEEKNEKYDETLSEMHLRPQEIAVVDDRPDRGIAWGNKLGATTIWIKRGKWIDTISPTKETGEPTHTITNLNELKQIL